MSTVIFSISDCETVSNDSHALDLPLHDSFTFSSSQLSVSVGFKRLFLHTVLCLNKWLNLCNCLLIDGASESHWECFARGCVCVCVLCVSTAPLFKKLIDRRVFGFSAAPKRWARFYGNVTGWPRRTGLGCDQCCWRDLQTSIHTCEQHIHTA